MLPGRSLCLSPRLGRSSARNAGLRCSASTGLATLSRKLNGPSPRQTPVRGQASVEACSKLVGSPQAASYPAARAASITRSSASPYGYASVRHGSPSSASSRALEPVPQLRVAEPDQAGVRARVRGDLPTVGVQVPQLVPAERHELALVRP